MIKKLIDYVEQLFESAPKTSRVTDLKDELKGNLIEKYNDLLAGGKSEDEAYNAVITGIGDINELVSQVEGTGAIKDPEAEKEKKRSALLLTIAIMLFILSPTPVILTGAVGFINPVFGVVLLFVFTAAGTGMLIYRSASSSAYEKVNETMVEEFKEWKSQKTKKDSLQNAINSSYWLIVFVIYFIVSFSLGIWAYSWLIFLIALAIYRIMNAVFELRS